MTGWRLNCPIFTLPGMLQSTVIKFMAFGPPAEKQGEVAGINMAGGNTSYNGTIPSHSITVAGIEVVAYGEIDVDCTLPSLVYKDREKGNIQKNRPQG